MLMLRLRHFRRAAWIIKASGGYAGVRAIFFGGRYSPSARGLFDARGIPMVY
jgi:hypothetical protein